MRGIRRLEFVDADGGARTRDRRAAEIAQFEIPRHQTLGVLAEINAVRSRELLHSLRDPDSVTLRGVVHAQVVAYLADHDIARVEAKSETKVQALAEAQFIGEGA